MRRAKAILFSSMLLLCTSCAAGLPESGSGVVVLTQQGEYSAGSTTSFEKKGEACSTNILSLVSVGDASIDTAMRNGGITKATSVDRDIFGLNIYIIKFAKSCTVVRGI